VGHGTDFSDEFSGTARTDELRKIGQSHPHSTPASLGGDIPDGDDELQSSDDEFVTFNPTDDCGAALSFGKSSEAVLIKTIVEMKKELLKPDGSEPGPVGEEHRLDGYLPTRRRQKFWRPELVSFSSGQPLPHRLLTSSGSGPTSRSMHRNQNTTSQILTYSQASWINTSRT